jgi:hypothetical protein
MYTCSFKELMGNSVHINRMVNDDSV